MTRWQDEIHLVIPSSLHLIRKGYTVININQANQEAVTRLIEAHPLLIGMGMARDVIPGMHDN